MYQSFAIPSSTLLYPTLLCVCGVIWRSTTCYSLRSPLHQFSSHFPKSVVAFWTKQLFSRLHPSKVHSEIRCIHMVLPRECLSPRRMKVSLIWSMPSAGMKQRVFLVYTEPSTMRIGEAGFEQFSNFISFSCRWCNIPSEKVFFLPRGDAS